MKKKTKKASEDKNNKQKTKREILFDKAKELKIPNYQKLSNKKLEEEILKIDKNTIKQEDNLKLLSRMELIDIAKELKIKNYSKLKKEKLIEEINKLKNNNSNIKEEENIKNSQNLDKDIEVKKEIPDNIKDLSKSELIEYCKYYKIKNYSKISKAKIIKILTDIKNNKSDNILKKEEKNIDKKETLKKANSKKEKTNLINKEKEILEEKKSQNKKTNEQKELKKKEQQIENEVKENAKNFQDDVKTKILFMPSKYGFGKTNEEFLLEDEKEINLKPSIIDNKDEITLMPIDPYKAYIYWTLSLETIKKLNKLKIKELILKLNDVTGIIYNGKNANSFWFEKCLLNSPNWYINMQKNNFNLCIELGYLVGNTFSILATSNVVHIPTATPSPIIKDEFVIVDFDIKKEHKEKENEDKKNFYKINDAKNILKTVINEKKNKLSKIKRIPKYFIKEYEIKKEKPVLKNQELKVKLPPKLPKLYFEIPKKQEVSTIHLENKINFIPKKKEINTNLLLEKNKYYDVKNDLEKEITVKKAENEKISNYSENKNNFYYLIPKENNVIKFYYSENINQPYQKIVYYFIEPVKKIHQKIYKISYGPSWIREFIGGSERIKFLGASERFLGASDIFMGASEKFLGGSDVFIGASEKFLGSSNVFLGSSEKYYLRKTNYYRFSEPISLNIDIIN